MVSILRASSKPFKISKDLVCGGFEAEVDDRYRLGIEVIFSSIVLCLITGSFQKPPPPEPFKGPGCYQSSSASKSKI